MIMQVTHTLKFFKHAHAKLPKWVIFLDLRHQLLEGGGAEVARNPLTHGRSSILYNNKCSGFDTVKGDFKLKI